MASIFVKVGSLRVSNSPPCSLANSSPLLSVPEQGACLGVAKGFQGQR